MTDSKKGLFIVFEGIDRSGKTTLSKRLVEYISKINPNCILIRFPCRTNITGVIINSVLTNKLDIPDETIHLLFSANRWEESNKIQRFLHNGGIVICDRYYDSGICYSIAKGLDEDWCKQSDKGLPEPDFKFFIDIEPIGVTSRSGYGDEKYETIEFQKKVYETYKKNIIKDDWILLDGTKTIDELFQTIISFL